jgi:uncharacterized protein YfaS (alpha-2-macroglobulin family)
VPSGISSGGLGTPARFDLQVARNVHLRALALLRDGNKPIAGQAATFEIEDAKGNKIFKKAITTDAYSIGATSFKIAQLVNLGTFTARVALGEAKSEKLPGYDMA